jgi:tetratricopeptide (TPR) repeat protein
MAEAESQLAQGIALARAGRKDEAYALLRRALFAEGDDATLRIWLGATAPNLNEALAHLERAVALAPDNPQARGGLDWVRQQLASAPAPPPTPTFAQRPPPPEAPPAPEPRPAGGGMTLGAPPPSRMVGRPLEPAATETAPPPGEGLACGNCGMPYRPGDRFCLRCGRPLGAPAPTAPAAEDGAGNGRAAGGLRRPSLAPPPAAPDETEAPLGLTIAPPPRSLTGRRLDDDAAPHSIPPPPTAPPPTISLGQPKAPPRGNRRGTVLLGVLVALVVLLLLAALAFYVMAIQPGQQAGANATATVVAAEAAATAAVVANATQEAGATATAQREATVAVRPTLTAKAGTDQYYKQLATILQQVETQDNDVTRTLEGVRNGTLDYDNAQTQFNRYADQSYEVRDAVTRLSAPADQREEHQSLIEALSARSRAVVAGKQLVNDLIGMALAQLRVDYTQQDLDASDKTCAEGKDKAACGRATLLRQQIETLKENLEAQRAYADQDFDQFSTNWDQYKQLMPGTSTGGDQ